MDGDNIVITSGNGQPIDVTFADTPDNDTTVGEFINLKKEANVTKRFFDILLKNIYSKGSN